MRGFANFGDERLPERFWSKCYPCPMSGCWIWFGATTHAGYAELNVQEGARKTPRYGHRLAFEALVGPIGEGLQIDHLCRNRCCVNPLHLESVTPTVNMKRSTAGAVRKAIRQAVTHCTRGHEYTERNTRLDFKGSRECRECKRLQMKYRRMAKDAGVRFFR